MAIVNRTPDSFHDRGRTFALEKAIEAVRAAADAGADWVDIGGVPFAPGPDVTAAEEIDRVLPVVEAARELADGLGRHLPPRGRPAVIAAGADVINDTSGLHDPALADAVADTGADAGHHPQPGRAAHPCPGPRTATSPPRWPPSCAERVDAGAVRGVRPEQIIIDPGHDLNKNTPTRWS